jgi:hypothetical protein
MDEFNFIHMFLSQLGRHLVGFIDPGSDDDSEEIIRDQTGLNFDFGEEFESME